jgi:hypothetical protein
MRKKKSEIHSKNYEDCKTDDDHILRVANNINSIISDERMSHRVAALFIVMLHILESLYKKLIARIDQLEGQLLAIQGYLYNHPAYKASNG